MNTFTSSDPLLLPYTDIILRRSNHAQHKYNEFTEDGKRTLHDVCANHLFYGLHRNPHGWTLREWAPNATAIYLIGECNNWTAPTDGADRSTEWQFSHIGGGRWELNLPPQAIWHAMHYKLLMHWHGGYGERLPSHCRRLTQDPHTKMFTAQVWQPDQPYQWTHPAPPKIPLPLLIYEAHIGMASERYGVGTYNEFRTNVLPRIAALGYNVLQLMAIQEHPYYGSFGYQVSNFYAPTSRCGTPEELMALIDTAHGMGIAVIMDIVHSHSVKNDNEGLAHFDGTQYQYFHAGARGHHPVWDSLCFDYSKNEVLAFLLSNCNYWMSEYRFDGFRFDGVTSMMYLNHGIGVDFTDYSMYFNDQQDEDAILYLTLANRLIHEINPNAITIAEDVSGMPMLAAANPHSIGFDYRLSMGIADFWIKTLKTKQDEQWHVGDMYYQLTNKHSDERTISYAECHDQAMVGDKTIAHWLLDHEMYTGMSALLPATPAVERGIALHKMIRLATIATADSGYLTFMGNEFGHPEWIDFPREGNNWSYHYARRQWSLVDNPDLRYKYLRAWDGAMIHLCKEWGHALFAALPFAIVQHTADQVLVFKRGDMVFAFNFNPVVSFEGYGFEIDAGNYQPLLCTDDVDYGGFGRVDNAMLYPTTAHGSRHYLQLYLPSRTAVCLYCLSCPQNLHNIIPDAGT
jgi:1,4-alpha-glucan branching enzyme